MWKRGTATLSDWPPVMYHIPDLGTVSLVEQMIETLFSFLTSGWMWFLTGLHANSRNKFCGFHQKTCSFCFFCWYDPPDHVQTFVTSLTLGSVCRGSKANADLQSCSSVSAQKQCLLCSPHPADTPVNSIKTSNHYWPVAQTPYLPYVILYQIAFELRLTPVRDHVLLL